MRKKSSAIITSTILLVSPVVCFAAPNEKPISAVKQTTIPSKTLENVNQKIAESSEKKEIFHPFTGKISAHRVRLRTQPNLEGHVVKEINAGELFAVVGEDSEYFIVQAPKGMKGYVFRTFVLEDVVEGARVNVRLQPDTDSPIIGQLNSGDKIKGNVSQLNNKWLEIDAPSTTKFFIAKEYVEKIGSLDLIEKQELRKAEATQLLNTALLFGQSELRKPFEEIDLNTISKNFEKLSEYLDIPEICEKSNETQALIQETYIQKKISFLESKADRTTVSAEGEKTRVQAITMEKNFQDKLSQMGLELNSESANHSLTSFAKATSDATGNALSTNDSQAIAQNQLTDKMRIWEPLEQSIYQIWATNNNDKNIKDFYEEEQMNATVLTGIIEPYSRPVKNRPGDFVLRIDNLPVAFLYSTKINLQDKIGQKVTVMATPRPNNNFAFPAYYVLSIE